MKKTRSILSLTLAILLALSAFAALPGARSHAEEENVALGKTAYVNDGNKNFCFRVTDGKDETFWSAVGVPLYAEVDLAANYKIERVVVKQPVKESYVRSYATAFNVYGSVDGVNFDRIGTMETPRKADENGFVFEISGAPEYRVIRAMSTMTTRGSYSSTYISEIEVYGTLSDTPVTPTRTSIDFPSYDEWLLQNCGVDLSKIRDENGKYDIKDTFTAADTLQALQGLVSRVLGAEYVSWFTFEVDEAHKGKDYYEISDDNGKIRIRGNEGVSIAAGLNHYLKYFCMVNVSQETKQVRMPGAVVPVGETIRNETALPVRYTYNYCTLSYTMSFYGYEQWQRELDYLMLSGINVVLDTTATEALWVLYLQNYGYTVQEAIEFVCGYTWKAWWLMGNLERYGGPVSDNWIVDTVELARQNQRYLAVMGADPCLQVFTGTMPTDFAAHAGKILQQQGYDSIGKYITATGSWAGFTRPYALNTTFDGFDSLAKKFYETQDYIYGRIGDYYAGDFLHEIEGSFQLDPQFNKANMSRTVLDKLLQENEDAVWIIQSWWANPLPEVVEGWGDDREDHILLLDLSAAQGPRWTNTTNYGGYEFGGTSWCYCILENYGGRDGAHLSLTKLARNIANAQRTAKHMKGIGLTSEGTERNPIVFDLFWEQAWSKTAINASTWIEQYAQRRYGGESNNVEAFKQLLKTVYANNTVDGTTVNCAIGNYPKFGYSGGYFMSSYSAANYEKALSLLLEDFDAFSQEETYRYDLVELFTTKLSDYATLILNKAFNAAKTADYDTFHPLKTRFLLTMRLLDELAAFEQDQTLGNWVGRVDEWVNDPRTGVYSDFDIDLMKLDAVILVTNWSGIDLGNYANRMYNGLIDGYYYVMWNNFMTRAETKILAGTAITSDSDTLGVTNTTTNYNIGRQLALDIVNGKIEYGYAPVPVQGDSTHRPMIEVLRQIAQCCFSDSEILPNEARLNEESTLSIENDVVSGTMPGNTADDFSAQFTLRYGGKAALQEEDGTILAGSEPVKEGLRVVILEEDGSVFDAVGLKTGKIVGSAGEEAYESARKTISGFEEEVSKLRVGEFDARVRQNVNAILGAKESPVLARLQQAAASAETALAEARAEDERVRKTAEALRRQASDGAGKLTELYAKTDVLSPELSREVQEVLGAEKELTADASLSHLSNVVSRLNTVAGKVVRAGTPAGEDPSTSTTPEPSVSEPAVSEASGNSEPESVPEKSGKDGGNAGLIVGIVCGALLLIGAAIAIPLIVKKKKK